MKIVFNLLIIVATIISCSSKQNIIVRNSIEKDIKQAVSINPESGWMANGYGQLKFEYNYSGSNPLNIIAWEGQWICGRKEFNKWDVKTNIELKNGIVAKGDFIGWMPGDVADAAIDINPVVKGNSVVVSGSDTVRIPFTIEIPVGKLPNATEVRKGSKIGIELQNSRWKDLEHADDIVKFFDDTYVAMEELTGSRPYGGDLMIIKECPANPYFAYAGNPIVLNTNFVGTSLETLDSHQVDFGWVHEMGHDFDDGLGQLYNFSTFTETQANLKLSYILDQLVTKNSLYKMKSWVDKETLLDGISFNDEYFPKFADDYLPTDREWKTLQSDEYHALFFKVIREEGWEVMKEYYRTFGRLVKSGAVKPQGDEEYLQLNMLVLQLSTKKDMLPTYSEWRLPVTAESLDKVKTKYSL